MSQMPWLKVASDCKAFNLGYTQGEGVIEELGKRRPIDFDGAILYRQTEPTTSAHTKIVRLDSPARLAAFTTSTITELYRRGILV